jgi:glycosyltransferase involved in cell wall biosynthesis
VLGTWNRKALLEGCLKAIRQSVGDLECEIIVVDGGSTDGTQFWLNTQPDVICIEQGELLGACPAFNAGFRLARAPYVVHINDDDEVQGDCIQRAVHYMEDNPGVGQGAFAFDLRRPGQYQFEQVFGNVYANKGITRRSCGDRARWWTNLFRTYGGDCELSCRIQECGWKVVGIKGCNVHDLNPQDELREYNNSEGRNHADSNKFYELRDGIAQVLPQKRVLHVALNYCGDDQPALVRALRTLGEYHQLDWWEIAQRDGFRKVGPAFEEACREVEPDLVFMQLQTDGVLAPSLLAKIKKELGCQIVHWSGDVREPMPGFYREIGEAIDLTLVTNMDWVDKLRAAGVSADYLQIGFNQEIFHPWGEKANVPPIAFMANHYGDRFPLSRQRYELAHFLRERYGDLVRVYGNGWDFEAKKLDWYEEAAAYRGCKIAIGMNQLNLRRYTSDRLFRAMGSGACYLPMLYPGMIHDFQAGEHVIPWVSQRDLGTVLDMLLHPSECACYDTDKIARAGARLVHEQHTWLDRIYQLRGLLGWHEWK